MLMGYVIIIPLITNRKENMYLIIKQQNFGKDIRPMYTVEDQAETLEKAETKGKGYELINDDEKITFHCVMLADD